MEWPYFPGAYILTQRDEEGINAGCKAWRYLGVEGKHCLSRAQCWQVRMPRREGWKWDCFHIKELDSEKPKKRRDCVQLKPGTAVALRHLGTCRADWGGQQGCKYVRTWGLATENSGVYVSCSRNRKAWYASIASKPETSLKWGKESNEQQFKT